MANQVNLNFHQTFKPEVQYISSILSISDGETLFEVKDISNMTGIPNGKSSGKVEPHILYASYMGLIEFRREDGKYVLSRTPLGQAVFSEDPGLQENLTILLCHAMMCRRINGADAWKAVFSYVLPKYKTGIKRDLLLKELEKTYPGKVTSKNIAPLFSSYEDMFSGIGILDANADTVSISSLQYNKEYVYLYALILFYLWEESIPGQDEISSVQFDTLSFGAIFGWNDELEYKVLESLSDKGIIRLNRQLMPYTILKLATKEYLIDKLYSELC